MERFFDEYKILYFEKSIYLKKKNYIVKVFTVTFD